MPGAADPAARDGSWITGDGGATWEQTTIDAQPVAAAPQGTKAVDCDLLQLRACAVGALDPGTGRVAALAGKLTGIDVELPWMTEINVPHDGRLWVRGLDRATGKPAVAASSDGGRTWNIHVFTGAATAVPGHGVLYLPKVAAGFGATAYVLIYRPDGVGDAYFTSDGGRSWRAGDTIRDADGSAGFVTADGAHIVATGTGLVAARGASRYTPVVLPGCPERPSLVQITSGQAAEPYLVTSGTGPYLSEDGQTWRRVRLP